MKLIILGLVLLLLILIGGACYLYENTEIDSEEIIIKNPKTGEVWNSIKEFEYRDLNLGDNG